jgi:hypothetical protein
MTTSKEHANALRQLRALADACDAPTDAEGFDVLGEYADAIDAAIDAAIALLDPPETHGMGPGPCASCGTNYAGIDRPGGYYCMNRACPAFDGDTKDNATTERERCIHFAVEITKTELHHGVAEIADVIQSARKEAFAETQAQLEGFAKALNDMNDGCLELEADNARLRIQLEGSFGGVSRNKIFEMGVQSAAHKHATLIKAARVIECRLDTRDWTLQQHDELRAALKGDP